MTKDEYIKEHYKRENNYKLILQLPLGNMVFLDITGVIYINT